VAIVLSGSLGPQWRRRGAVTADLGAVKKAQPQEAERRDQRYKF